jgi:NitT/TauT family transport system permease protein
MARASVNREGLSTFGFFAASIVLLALLWEFGVVLFDIPSYLVPRFTTVISTVLEKQPVLWHHTWVTGYETVLGFVLAVAVSIPLAILITYSRIAEKIVYPWMVASQVVPKVAVAPLFVVWFGFGITPKIIVAFLIAFFPIVVDTTVGLKSTETEMLYLARSMGGGTLKTFLKVRVPNALPNIFGGLKVGITFAVVGALVGEFVGASEGLGYLLLTATGSLDTPMVFASLLAMTLLGVFLFGIVEITERLLVPWRADERTERQVQPTS